MIFLANLVSSGKVPSFRYKMMGFNSRSINCSVEKVSPLAFSATLGPFCNKMPYVASFTRNLWFTRNLCNLNFSIGIFIWRSWHYRLTRKTISMSILLPTAMYYVDLSYTASINIASPSYMFSCQIGYPRIAFTAAWSVIIVTLCPYKLYQKCVTAHTTANVSKSMIS